MIIDVHVTVGRDGSSWAISQTSSSTGRKRAIRSRHPQGGSRLVEPAEESLCGALESLVVARMFVAGINRKSLKLRSSLDITEKDLWRMPREQLLKIAGKK